MKTLGRNGDNDLYLEAGGLAIVHDADAQCAIIESILQTQKGELQFDEEGGIDYFGTVLQSPQNIDFWAAEVTSKIESLDFVAAVEDFQYRFDGKEGALFWSMTVINTDDERLDLQNKKIVLDGTPSDIQVDWNNIYDKPSGAADALNMLEVMRDEAISTPDLVSKSTLRQVKDALNRVVYEPNSPEYLQTRQLKFKFVGVPLGSVIDFSNLRLGLKKAADGKFYPYTVELSDGTKHRIEYKSDGSDLSDSGNDLWFPDTTKSQVSEGHYPPTFRHTVMKVSGGVFEMTIRGDLSGISCADSSKPIFLRSGGTAFPYLQTFEVGERVPLASIGEGAFAGFKNLSTISWNQNETPENITFGKRAFSQCESLAGLTWIPSTLQSIGSACFKGCSGLKSLEGLVLASQTEIPDECFADCSSLQSVEWLPNTITVLGNNAFQGCGALKDIKLLLDGIVKLGNGCFSGCRGITALLYMPQSLTTIGNDCFRGCSALRSLFLPYSLSEKIGSNAFAECPSLTNVMCESETVT